MRSLLWAGMLGACLTGCDLRTPSDPPPDAQELYSLVVAEVRATWALESELVIDPRTYSRNDGGRYGPFVGWEGSADLDVGERLAAAYNAANAVESTLLGEAQLGRSVRLLTRDEQEELDSGSTIWGNNIVILRFSRVGFDLSSDSALLHYGVLCGPACGEGTWVRFVRSDGKWVVDGDALAWLS